MTKRREVCPVCAEKGINELREVATEEVEGKAVKTYSPCGHKSVVVTVEDKIALKDEVKVGKTVAVSEELKLRDSVSVAEKVLQGYELLSGTFNVSQVVIAQKFNLEENLKQLVELTKEQVEYSKKDSKKQDKRFYASTAIAIIAIIVAVLTWLFK
ncbi:MAG: hypothetical protein QXL10_01105 [Candidatus Bathyarchaeia archaeon]